ncbi:uncharacterized mitochondrial protein AtMg00810-like [Rutidosis leptorrhynchoides]|uniref:uncharacterized mitochondrial protein AtMg00810-like n=1 Tax=Rutidosis leptorrhynchoides TaxID=125765 RepID=UPI003A99F214
MVLYGESHGAFLIQFGFSYSLADPSLFVYKKDLGYLSYFLGLEVAYTNSGLFLSQTKYAHDILVRAGLVDSKPAATPLATTKRFTSHGTLLNDPTFYRSLVGALQYLMITCPDISYAVNQVMYFLHAPTTDHFQAVKRIIRYVKGTLVYGLSFHHASKPSLLGYSDADWARCIETRRSTYGYSIFLGGNLISWSAKKQPTVARSSCESEYRALANTAAEIVWITHLLHELYVLPSERPTILCDNKSTIFLSQNPISIKRSKHIDINYHFVCELVSSGKLYTKFVPTTLQLAEIFTKSIPRSLFESFRSKLHVGPPPVHLKGGGGRMMMVYVVMMMTMNSNEGDDKRKDDDSKKMVRVNEDDDDDYVMLMIKTMIDNDDDDD